jgi:hypothetical protein
MSSSAENRALAGWIEASGAGRVRAGMPPPSYIPAAQSRDAGSRAVVVASRRTGGALITARLADWTGDGGAKQEHSSRRARADPERRLARGRWEDVVAELPADGAHAW